MSEHAAPDALETRCPAKPRGIADLGVGLDEIVAAQSANPTTRLDIDLEAFIVQYDHSLVYGSSKGHAFASVQSV